MKKEHQQIMVNALTFCVYSNISCSWRVAKHPLILERMVRNSDLRPFELKGGDSSSNMYLMPLGESISLCYNNYCCSLPVSKVVCDDFSLINVKTFKPSILGAVFYSNACQKCLKLLNALNQGEMVFWKNQPTNKHKKKEKGKHKVW